MPKLKARAQNLIERHDFQSLLDVLAKKGYQLVGPIVQDGSIVYDEVRFTADFPVGYSDEQEKGSYRLHKGNNQALFNYTVSPQSWKKYLCPPSVRLWQAHRHNGNLNVVPEQPEATRLALIGVRACELNAIAIQDRVFMGGDYIDPLYTSRREHLFIVAVNCSRAGNTCFCASMQTGPQATAGFDLALTEVLEPTRHYFVVETGSEQGEKVLKAVPHRPATDEEQSAAKQLLARTAQSMRRSMDTDGIKELLYANLDHPRWDEIAKRCLACGNCTMVCPTCFCTNVEDVTSLSGDTAERWRKWDSCFTTDFSYIVGGSIRASVKSRYRQWMTHKLASWIDQFGTSGCVGCGRCITWCPVGIDITEELSAIRAEGKIVLDSEPIKEESL